MHNKATTRRRNPITSPPLPTNTFKREHFPLAHKGVYNEGADQTSLVRKNDQVHCYTLYGAFVIFALFADMQAEEKQMHTASKFTDAASDPQRETSMAPHLPPQLQLSFN